MTDKAESNNLEIIAGAPVNSPALASALINYCLYLADNALVMGHRLSEWTGHGPMLEQDIALTNIALDLIGQARNFYKYAASCINTLDDPWAILTLARGISPALKTHWLTGAIPASTKMFCSLNCLMEIGLYPVKIIFFTCYQWLFYEELSLLKDAQLSAIAAKSLKEVTYHVKWSSEWVIRLGDGTKESHQRLSTAFNELEAYTPELFVPADFELTCAEENTGVDPRTIKNTWAHLVNAVFYQACLPPLSKFISTPGAKGKQGTHSMHLENLLQQMQHLQRTHPGCEW